MKRKKDELNMVSLMEVEEIFLLDESTRSARKTMTTSSNCHSVESKTKPIDTNVNTNLAEEYVDEYNSGNNGGWSSATSSYFSCSESTSNLANSNSYDEEECLSESDDDAGTSPVLHGFSQPQLDLIQAVCNEIDLKFDGRSVDVKSNKQFWSFLLNRLELSGLLNGQKVDSFWVNLNRLLVCLRRVQAEMQTDDEHTLVNLTLALFEWVNGRGTSEQTFEGYLDFAVGELMLRGDLQRLTSSCLCTICRYGGGECDELTVNLLKPRYTSDRVEFVSSNPITQSYKCLVSNLTKLNYYSTDPTYTDEADEARVNDYNNNTSGQAAKTSPNGAGSFGALLASYYTMGHFDLRKCLFDNTYQHLYEQRAFAAEMSVLFKNDLRLADSTTYQHFENGTNRTRAHPHKSGLAECKSLSRWPNVTEPTDSRSSPMATHSETSLYEDILRRIENLNQTSLFESYFKILKDASISVEKQQQQQQQLPAQPAGRNWTVAPKLFPTNTTINCSGKRLHSLNGNCSSNEPNPSLSSLSSISSSQSSSNFLSKNFLNEKTTWSQGAVKTPSGTDARPIGTKPASMFSNSGRYRNAQTSNKYVYVNPNLVKSSNASSNKQQPCVQISNIWTRNGVAVSPFIAYEPNGFNLYEPIDLKKSITNRTPPSVKPLRPMEIKTNKFSVAPLGLVTCATKKPSANYRNYIFQQQQPQSPVVYTRQNSSPIKRTIVSYPLTIEQDAKNSSSSMFRSQYHHPQYNNQPMFYGNTPGGSAYSSRTRNAFPSNRR